MSNFFLFLLITGATFLWISSITQKGTYLVCIGSSTPLVTTMGDLPSLLRKIYQLHACQFDHINYKSRNGTLVRKIYRIDPDRWTPSIVSKLSKCLKFMTGMSCHTQLNTCTSVKLLRLSVTVNFTKDERR